MIALPESEGSNPVADNLAKARAAKAAKANKAAEPKVRVFWSRGMKVKKQPGSGI